MSAPRSLLTFSQQVVRLVPEIDAPIAWQSFNLAMVIVHEYVLCT
ncbi:hypothetical protein ACTM7X_04375 [Citrobacter braakii]